MFEGLDAFGGDDSFFDKNNEMIQTQTIQRGKSKMGNKKSSENTSQTPSSKANMKTGVTKAQLRKEIAELKRHVEDAKQMAELQCMVVEDLIKQRASTASSKTPSPSQEKPN